MVAPVRDSRFQRFAGLVKVGIVLASCSGALLTRNLGLLNVVSGSVCVGVFVGLTPGLVGLHLLGKPKLQMLGLMAVGAAMSALGFVFTQNYASDNAAHCMLPI